MSVSLEAANLVKSQNTFEEAFARHVAGALPEAESAYRAILDQDPVHVEATHYLGLLLHQLGRSIEGVQLVRQALALDPDHAVRHNDFGNLLSALDEHVQAASAFRRSLELNPLDANVWNNYGSTLHRLHQLAEAEAAYRQALDRMPDFVPALRNLSALLAERGQDEESSLHACQAYIQPPFEGKPYRLLGVAYYRLGLAAQAAECHRQWLQAEPDNPVARHLLAACSGESVPPRATNAFIATLFDEMAGSFDDKLVGKLSYRGPDIIANLLASLPAADGTLDVLDAGCGTGLCAPVLAPYAHRLTGVDLSEGMIARAAAQALYQELTVAELTGYLQDHAEAYDLIVLADTLIYFGDLTEVLAAVAGALRSGGHCVFTVEAASGEAATVLDPSGRYRHARAHVLQALGHAGFTVLEDHDVVLRQEFCQPATGIGLLARRAPP